MCHVLCPKAECIQNVVWRSGQCWARDINLNKTATIVATAMLDKAMWKPVHGAWQTHIYCLEVEQEEGQVRDDGDHNVYSSCS